MGARDLLAETIVKTLLKSLRSFLGVVASCGKSDLRGHLYRGILVTQEWVPFIGHKLYSVVGLCDEPSLPLSKVRRMLEP